MMIHAKLGTGPAGYYNVLYKRVVKAGDIIEIRPFVLSRGKWDKVRVVEIRKIGNEPFYVLELW